MNKFFKFSIAALSIVLMAGVLGSCKKKFDEPPAAVDPDLTVTHTIKQLKALHTIAGAYNLIADDIIISGVVISSDKSGNIYKQLYIQDSTGAIAINVDVPSIGTSFPLGRKIFVKAQGLTLSDDNKQMQLGIKYVLNGTPGLQGIPPALVSKYLIGGSLNNPVVAHLVTPSQLGGSTLNMQDRYIGDLVQLENYEFVNADKGKTYADTSTYKTTVNLNVRNCSGASSNLIVRTSAYSNFAGVNVPDGNGTLTAIYTVYGNTKQMIIRDTNDVQFNGIRCDGSVPGTDAPLITIAALRALYAGSNVDIASNRITGVVISDPKNIGAGNIVIQQGTSGVDLFFGTSAAGALSALHVGDSIVVDISGGSLQSYNGMIELVLSSGAVPLSAVATGKTVTPVKRTIADVIANMASIENTLVTIDNALATSGTYSGNKTLTDATGTMIIRTLSTADFAATNLPATCQNWTGYVSRFNTDNQIYIRTLADVTVGTSCPTTPPPPPPPPGSIFSENFESYTASTTAPFAGTGWQNLSYPATEDKSKFFVSSFSGAKFLKVSSFASTQVATSNITSWLITPAISLVGATTPKLSFTTAARYTTGTLKIMISTNYNSANPPSSATWTDITSSATLPTLPSSAFTAFIPSGNIDLSAYIGQSVYIAYRYDVPSGTLPAAIATYEIDDVLVKN